jgi:hypothetical protein
MYFTKNERLDDITSLFHEQLKGEKGDSRLWRAIKLLLENLIASDDKLVSIPLDRAKLYKTPSRYNPARISPIHLRKIVNYLSERDYIEKEGHMCFADFKVPTRIRSKKKLKVLLRSTGLSIETLGFDRDMEPIVLKSKTKYMNRKSKKYKKFQKKQKYNKKIDYHETTRTKRMRKFLKSYNIFLKKQKFTISQKQVDVFFRRIFNEDFKSGGRFYASFQSLKSSMDKCEEHEMSREELHIDGEETVEIDYSGMHINILYIKSTGELYKGDDVYTVKNYEQYRNVFKVCLQVVINSSSKTAALRGINNHLRKISCGLKAAELLALFEDKHEEISEYFYSGAGLRLQYLESKVAERIFKYFHSKAIPILSVHDSFIAPISYEDELIEQMKESSKVVVGQALDIDIKEKSGSYKQDYSKIAA